MKYKTLLIVFLFIVSAAIYFTLSSPQGNGPQQTVAKPSTHGIVPQKTNAETVPNTAGKIISVSKETKTSATTITTGSEDFQTAPELEPEIRAALKKILNTSSEGLVEVKENNSTNVNLQGRFKTAPVATIDERGSVQVTDYSHLPE